MESRNASLKVIVETAKEILGVSDVTVEMVVDMLNNSKGGVFHHDIDKVEWGWEGFLWEGVVEVRDLFGLDFLFLLW